MSSATQLFSCSLLLLFMLFFHDFAQGSLDNGMVSVDGEGDMAALYNHYRRPNINCNFACSRRCMRASRKKVCMRACGTCCLRCHCVPAGTYGNKHTCPCYASLRTHGHRPKCP